MDRDLPGLGGKPISLYTDDITDVEQLFEYGIIKGFVFTGTDIVASHVDLNTTRFILQFGKGGRAHNATAHNPAGNGNLAVIAFLAFVILKDLLGRSIHLKK